MSDVSVSLPTLLAVPGGLAVLVSMAPTDRARQVLLLIGVGLLAGSFAASSGSGGVPSPPKPTPPPVVGWQQQVVESFTGTAAEAQSLGALCLQFAAQLAWDGQRQQPVVKDTNALGQLWQQAQRWQALGDSPWGSRFPGVVAACLTELRRRGIVTDKRQDLTPQLRAEAVAWWKELAVAFAAAGK